MFSFQIKNNLRNSAYLPFLVGTGVYGITFGMQTLFVFIPDMIIKLDDNPRYVIEGCFDNQQLIIFGRNEIMAVHLSQRQIKSMPFYIRIRQIQLPQYFITAYFKPFDVICMVNYAHCIRIGIDYPYFG